MTRKSIFSLLVVLGGCILLVACGGPGRSTEEVPEEAPIGYDDPRGFDPLELPADREVVPAAYPREGIIAGRAVLVDAEPEGTPGDSAEITIAELQLPVDTLNNQAFRVQIFTTKLYGEARAARRVAEEIFDQPVYVDYEVPYFKVRAGSFAERDDAEKYQQQARAAGYTNAWVVMVNLNTKKVAPVYDELLGLPVDEAQSFEDSVLNEITDE